jgi:hypothetical protein
LPTTQARHVALLEAFSVGEKVPPVQFVGCDEFTGQKFPAGQPTHACSEPCRGLPFHVPLGHGDCDGDALGQ